MLSIDKHPSMAHATAASLGDLAALIPNASIIGDPQSAVSSLSQDTRTLKPRSLFFAIPGLHIDGAGFVDQAIASGAAAVCLPLDSARDNLAVPQLLVPNVSQAMALIAQAYNNFPDQNLKLAGITGTNGKTSVTAMLAFLLKASNHKTGAIGTIQYDLGNKTIPASFTTPESIQLYHYLAEMVAAECDHAVMEVSSHALELARIYNARFEVAAFLNLTREHLDFHGSLDHYAAAKTKLFNGQNGGSLKTAVLNADDPVSDAIAKSLQPNTELVTFSTQKPATLYAKNIQLHPKFTQFTCVIDGQEFSVTSPLLGQYNVANTLAALSVYKALGFNPADGIQHLQSFPGVRGRMEPVNAGQDFSVLIDYAHTPDALLNALKMLRSVVSGKLITVFGCGGNRDRTKRPEMLRAVQQYADFAFATADNSRFESLDQIFDDMKAGTLDAEKLSFVPERRRAIELAIKSAGPDDCVLIAGKGHETVHEINGLKIPFDDAEVAREFLTIPNLHNSHA